MTTMLRTTALWASAIVTTGFGLALLFMPATLADYYGTESTDATVMMSRIFGAVTIGLTVLAITALRVEDVNGRRAIDATFMAGYLFIAAATLWNTWEFGVADAEVLIWSTVGLYVVLAAAFAYFLVAEDMGTGVRRPRSVA